MDEKVRHMCGRSSGEMGSRNSWLQALESWNVPRCGIWFVSWRSFQPRALVGMCVGLVTWTYGVRRDETSKLLCVQGGGVFVMEVKGWKHSMVRRGGGPGWLTKNDT